MKIKSDIDLCPAAIKNLFIETSNTNKTGTSNDIHRIFNVSGFESEF